MPSYPFGTESQHAHSYTFEWINIINNLFFFLFQLLLLLFSRSVSFFYRIKFKNNLIIAVIWRCVERKMGWQKVNALCFSCCFSFCPIITFLCVIWWKRMQFFLSHFGFRLFCLFVCFFVYCSRCELFILLFWPCDSHTRIPVSS